ncbi:MAG: hypothetical protein IT532_06840 [Burkholderiales bacterium]|nr:hypothetical protein [Burkholderiales bacterium]
MEQLRLGFPPRDASNPVGRLLFGLAAVLVGLAATALLIFVILPLLGIIVSAAVGGMILAIAGMVMMIPFMLVAATVLAFIAKTEARRPGTLRARTHWR